MRKGEDGSSKVEVGKSEGRSDEREKKEELSAINHVVGAGKWECRPRKTRETEGKWNDS